MADLDGLVDREWFMNAVFQLKSMLSRLRERWDDLTPNHRQLALGAAYALWRAAYLIFEDRSARLVDHSEEHARQLLDDLIKTEDQFLDNTKWRRWSGSYYINNAIYRVSELVHGQGSARSFNEAESLTDAWNQTFGALDEFIGYASDPHGASTVRFDRPKRTT